MTVGNDNSGSTDAHRVALFTLATQMSKATTREPEVFLAAVRDFCRAARELGVPAGALRLAVEYHVAGDASVDASTRVRARELADAYARHAG